MSTDLETAKAAIAAERLRLEELERAYAMVEAHQKLLAAAESHQGPPPTPATAPDLQPAPKEVTPPPRIEAFTVVPPIVRRRRKSNGSKTAAVREVILNLADGFDLHDVMVELAEVGFGESEISKGDVSTILYRLRAKEGFLDEVAPGHGKKPATYKVAKKDSGSLLLEEGGPR